MSFDKSKNPMGTPTALEHSEGGSVSTTSNMQDSCLPQRNSESETDRSLSSGEVSLAPEVLSDKNTDMLINDEHFINDLGRLKDLRSFLIQEAVRIDPSDSTALEFERLNLLRYNSSGKRHGRDPTEEEWTWVERHTRILFSLLTPSLRRQFVLGAVPEILAWLPIGFTLIALASLILAVVAYGVDLFGTGSVGLNVLPFYLGWLMSLGAIGAIAFIGMNALSVQEDITFDLTNKRLIILRITLGALFALVLTLPFGFAGFIDFCKSIGEGYSQAGSPTALERAREAEGAPTVRIQAIMLVLPFVFGFSTSLVILILNRLVGAVQSFFGRSDQSSSIATEERGLRPTGSTSSNWGCGSLLTLVICAKAAWTCCRGGPFDSGAVTDFSESASQGPGPDEIAVSAQTGLPRRHREGIGEPVARFSLARFPPRAKVPAPIDRTRVFAVRLN